MQEAPVWRNERTVMRKLRSASEEEALAPLLDSAELPEAAFTRARWLVRAARRSLRPGMDVSSFLTEFGLDTREGIALMCLAEALLRIPDAATADRLIEDRIGTAAWEEHLGHATNFTVNASAFAFMLTGRVLSLEEASHVPRTIGRLIRRLGEPVIRAALRQGMRLLARQFVAGRNIEEAFARLSEAEGRRWRYSFDMLGEAAKTAADAARYMRAYQDAIAYIGKASNGRGVIEGPGISVKLSALHPRYEPLQAARCVPALVEALSTLAEAAKAADIGLTVDAEEADRLELSLDIFAALRQRPALAGWHGLGLAVQAYQKCAPAVIGWVVELARATGHQIPLRLVKGAYWDSEIKFAQVQGLAEYPVFTRKAATDVCWLACARQMLAAGDLLFPAFATHNALSLAAILELAGSARFEMQRLHGMGEALYENVVGPSCPVRVYAPVGSHEDLLAYLVRRLLENGANTGFVHRLVDPAVPEEAIVADPVAKLRAAPGRNRRIPLPRALYPDRVNSAGHDWADREQTAGLLAAVLRFAGSERHIPGEGPTREIRDPADRTRLLGVVHDATEQEIDAALGMLAGAWRAWDARGGQARADILDRAAALIEANRAEFLYLLAREAGKTLPDGISEVREAADACRWYAARAREQFAGPRELAGPTGERNTWELGGRGVFAAISSWNFPLAIFVGQIAAALAAGNAVAAKPAEQTPLIAARAVELFYEAGVPKNVLRLLPGDGRVGAALVKDPRISGVVFTGGTETGWAIARALAARPGPIVPLIAETGGINAMIVDSSALPEQVVTDVIASAFQSAGQRCSALRLLCLQEEIAPKVLAMLQGAAKALQIGDPLELSTDIGPVIDQEALQRLSDYCARMPQPLFALSLPDTCARGTFFAPRAYEIASPADLREEVFGPVLHVVRFAAASLDAILDAIAANGYRLTLGVHSRIEAVQSHIVRRLRVGNAYVNRNQIGAVIGVQPFGGHGLSGTGPKAGGPITLYRFAEEQVITVNTAAVGGNAALFATDEG
jgi:RHH-type proline utilization regulon transcriptional repressor/proline dehydrogenase/delta 1-pyrroline-5-carboxylate dehydrogenase